jgi:mRNA-degrading endonuclease RelE of RelBE toxin-antitoxin system
VAASDSGQSQVISGMTYTITITDDADRQFRALPIRQQRILEAGILSRLQRQPTTPTKAIKRLRPNPLAEFELRAGDLRALYNVEGEEVVILIVGRKVGNKLIVEGEEFHGHQDHPVEPPGNGCQEDAE